MAEITNATTRRRLQLYRNNPIEITTAQAAEDLLIEKKDELYDGEIVIARYGANDGVLGIRTNTDKENGMVLFDSAALSSALQSVSGGTGISVTEKENNNQFISLDITGSTSLGKITIEDKTSGTTIAEITGLTAANVTYDNGTGENADKVIKEAETTSAAIKELDAALDAANKANLTGATVSAENSKATVTFKNQNEGEAGKLAEFTVESTDANLSVATTGTTGITLDIKSVGGNYDNTKAVTERLSVSGDIDATDALAQRSYVDAKVEQALDSSSTSVGAGKYSKAEGETISVTDVVFTRDRNVQTSDKYYINIKTGKDQAYDIELDATDFVKDSFLSKADTVKLTGEPVRPTGDDKGKATNIAQPGESYDVYIELEMTCKGDADVAEHKEYIYVKTSDILGDLVGGDGIKDITDGTIDIDLAAAATGRTYVQLGIDTNKKLNVTVDQANVSGTTVGDGEKTWAVSGTDKTNNLASAENLAAVANDLQDQIDLINGKEIEGSNAIDVSEADDTTTISLILDAQSTDTIENNQYVGTANNVLQITEHGLFLSNVWDCGIF